MRTTQRSTRARLAPAGLLTAGAVVAALLVAPSAAFAVTLDSMSPAYGPVGTTVTATKTGGYSADGPGVIFTTTSSCPSTYNITAPNVAAANVNKVSANAVSFTVPTTLPGGTAGAVKQYYVCTYVGTTAGTSLAVNDAGSSFTLTPGGTVSPATGNSGGGGTVTLTLPSTATVVPATPGVTFALSSTGCPGTYGASPTNPSTTVTRTSTTVLTASVPAATLATGLNTPYTICVYAGTGTSSALLATSSTGGYAVTLPATTLNNATQPPSTSGNPVNLTINSTSNFLTGVTAPAAVFLASPTTAPTSCSALYPASPGTNMAATVRKLANNKAALTVPIGPVVSGGLPTPYNLCIYSSTSTTTGKLLSVVSYTVANVPTITAVTPNSGPALGNSTITVSGTYFPSSGITATLGGAPLTQITPLDANTFTAVTPPHATGPVTLSVTTSIGSDSMSSAYTYLNSVSVSPNTAPSTVTAQDVDVQGTGFFALSFGSSSTAAKVYLVNGVYNGRGATNKANGPVANCGNVIVITDSELVCSLNLTGALDNTGTASYTNYRAGVAAGVTSASNVLTLTSATFNPNDIGAPVVQASNTNIPAGTTIVAITSPTTALMSANASSTAASITVTIGTTGTATVTSGAQDAFTVTGAANAFSQANVGSAISGTGIGTNAVITGVDPTGATATLSVANSAAISGSTTATLTSGNPVPDGAYNITVVTDGALNAATTDTTYNQSVISSQSTFTVAPF